MCNFTKKASASGGLRPPDPWGSSSPRPPTGSPPLDPAGGLPSADPHAVFFHVPPIICEIDALDTMEMLTLL